MRKCFIGLSWLFAFALFAAWLFRDVLVDPTATVPTGYTHVSTVQSLNMWVIWWNGEQLASGFPGYWDAPIFYPTRGALAFSEPQPITMLLAPLYWLTGSLPLTYNVWVLTAFALNGFSTRYLLKTIGVFDFLAGSAGFAVMMLPAIFPQLDAVQIVHFWPATFTIALIGQLLRKPNWTRSVACGISLIVCFLLSIHQGLLFSLVLAGSGWFLVPTGRIKALKYAAAAIVIAATVLFPLGLMMHQQLAVHDFERAVQTVLHGSASPRDYLALPTPQLRYDTSTSSAGPLCPGMVRCGLALLSLLSLASKRRRWWIAFFVAFGVCAFTLSLGPKAEIAGVCPWDTLTAVFSPLNKLRNIKRFAIFAQLAVIWLAFVSLHHLALLTRRGRGYPFRRTLPGVCTLFAILETPPPQIPVAEVPSTKHFPWAQTLKEISTVDEAVWCLPMSGGPRVDQMSTEASWMLAATVHGRPIVNGYSGFYPDSYLQTAQRHVIEPFPVSEIDRLQECGVVWLVMSKPFAIAHRDSATFKRLEQASTNDDHFELYRIRPNQSGLQSVAFETEGN